MTPSAIKITIEQLKGIVDYIEKTEYDLGIYSEILKLLPGLKEKIEIWEYENNLLLEAAEVIAVE